MMARGLVLPLVPLALALSSCSSNGDPHPSAGAATDPNLVAGFTPPPRPDGYTRYVTPVMHGIAPGTDAMWCQWLTGPADDDRDVLDLTGAQSKLGHHVILYATSEAQPVGTSRVCTNDDMGDLGYLGGIGGEGTTAVQKLAPGVAMRLRKGQYLMANVHFLNPTSETVDGQAVIDVKTDAPSPDRKVAGLFANVGTTFQIPPRAQGFAQDVTCTMKESFSFFALADHMHANGHAAYTEITHPDGSKERVVHDDSWLPEYQFNPRFTSFPVDTPFEVHAGDTLRTHCEWDGDLAKTLAFPDEMCVTFGFYVAPPGKDAAQVSCADGEWSR